MTETAKTDRELRSLVLELRSRAGRLRSIAESLEATAEGVEVELGGGDVEMVGGREVIEKLEDVVDVGETFHYRELLVLLRSSGYLPRGKDPSETLLSNLLRSKGWESVAPRSGKFRRIS